MNAPVSSHQIDCLLAELCADLGFCLPPDARTRLMQQTDADVDDFTDEVIRAEGFGPYPDIPVRLRRDVRRRVMECFRLGTDGDAA